MANGDEGDGEAAAGDHLQAVYRFWLVGHQLGRGAAPWIDPYSFQPLVDPQVILAGWPFGLAFWPLDALFGPVVAWNLLLLGIVVAAGLLTYGWLRELELPPAAAAARLTFAVVPLGHRCRRRGGTAVFPRLSRKSKRERRTPIRLGRDLDAATEGRRRLAQRPHAYPAARHQVGGVLRR